VPKQSADLSKLELSGWEEIRKALEEVEELRKQGLDARIEIIDTNDDSGLCMTLRSFRDLQQYLSHRLGKMLMASINSPIPLDDFERLVSETSASFFEESGSIRGKLIE
jgi:hypothetical protein